MFELLTLSKRAFHTEVMMQLSFKKDGGKRTKIASNLSELREGERAVLDRLDLPEDTAKRLMELGFVPGHIVEPARSAPGGEPRVYRVDGSEIAIRRDTAKHLLIRKKKPAGRE
jgi:ferrous iron transport protein A